MSFVRFTFLLCCGFLLLLVAFTITAGVIDWRNLAAIAIGYILAADCCYRAWVARKAQA